MMLRLKERARRAVTSRWKVLIPVFALVAALLTLTTGASSASAAGSASPVSGGSLSVLETSTFLGAWPAGLYPPTDTSDAADFPYMDAIYGDLIEMGPGGKLIPDLAQSFTTSADAKTITLHLRPGVKFTDGTPLNAAAVKTNWLADVNTKTGNGCSCASSFPFASITTPNSLTVVAHLTKPYSPFLDDLPQNALDWMYSPTAVTKMGVKAFAINPVGAGPFKVSSDTLNSKLVLAKNPTYWETGKPYLNQLTFAAIGNDTSAVDAIQAGQYQVENYFDTYSLLDSAKKTLRAEEVPAPTIYDIQLNTAHAPFNNIKARQALIYASDTQPIMKALTNGTGNVTQSPSAPGSIVYQPTVAGYPTYNPAKAKALVQQLGGLSMTLYTSSAPIQLQASESLQSEWQAVGIKVTLVQMSTLQAILNAFKTNSYDGIVQGIGGITPFLNNGGSLLWRVTSGGPFTSVADPKLDALINKVEATVNPVANATALKAVYSYMANNAYILYMFGAPYFTISQTDVHGPGIDTGQPFPFWQDVYVTK
jgi:peptide/nickel transport system substrate-binding protein